MKDNLFYLGTSILYGIYLFLPFKGIQRDLIQYDDHTFIAPLKNLGLMEYFTVWSKEPENYAFPLRDLTFFMDFRVSEVLGWNTFWFTNYLLLVVGFFFFYKILEALFESSPNLAKVILLFVLFHPVNIEMAHWASNRKHIMVALFIAIGTLRVLKVLKKEGEIDLKDWSIIAGSYFLGWLCWPSITLWIVWAIWALRSKLTKSWLNGIGVASTLLVMFYQTISNYTSRASYSEGHTVFAETDTIARSITYFFEAIGRGVYTIFAPHNLQPYYKVGDILNIWGLVFLFLTIVFFLFCFFGLAKKMEETWKLKKKKQKELKLLKEKLKKDLSFSRNFLILAALIFAPTGAVFVTYSHFVWADRYIFLILPYIAISLFIALNTMFNTRALLYIVLGVLTVNIYLGYKSIPRWESSIKLFTKCSQDSQSPQCLYSLVEEEFDKNGCANLAPHFKQARELFKKKGVFLYHEGLNLEMPLYEGLCVVADKRFLPKEKRRRINEIKSIYPFPKMASYSEVIVHVQKKEMFLARKLAREEFFNTSERLRVLPKSINLLIGLGEGLCTIESIRGRHGETCNENINQFKAKVGDIPRKEQQIAWGRNRVVEAFNGN